MSVFKNSAPVFPRISVACREKMSIRGLERDRMGGGQFGICAEGLGIMKCSGGSRAYGVVWDYWISWA